MSRKFPCSKPLFVVFLQEAIEKGRICFAEITAGTLVGVNFRIRYQWLGRRLIPRTKND